MILTGQGKQYSILLRLFDNRLLYFELLLELHLSTISHTIYLWFPITYILFTCAYISSCPLWPSNEHYQALYIDNMPDFSYVYSPYAGMNYQALCGQGRPSPSSRSSGTPNFSSSISPPNSKILQILHYHPPIV